MPTPNTTTSARLSGRTAIVTGGGSGIGRATALLFAQHGARVAILDLNADTTMAQMDAERRTAMQLSCDVSKQKAVEDAFATIAKEYGPPDILVTSAGVAHIGTVETTTEEDFDRVYSVNVKGVYNCLRSAVVAMKGRGGAILNVASVVSSIGVPDRFAYSMSKGAVVTMTMSIARDYVTDGIRCNVISPGRVHTPFVDGFIAKNYPGREKEMFDVLAKTQPIGRMGQPAEIAELALFLCSDTGAFMTGSNYAIDGGFASLKM